MAIGIIRYPGSNCDAETLRYFEDSFYIWHNETDLKVLNDLKLLVLPGGFAFGDRMYNKATEKYKIQPAVMASKSPVSAIIMEAHKRNIPILGICNGFQILIELSLLPGTLALNNSKKFICKKVECELLDKTTTQLYIANSYGRYLHFNRLDYNVFLTYKDRIKEYDNEIAGIYNNEKNVFGMMPHPERNNIDFKCSLYKIILGESDSLYKQAYFQKRIDEIMFSEHVSYKSTRRYLKKLPTWSNNVIQGPGENAGIVDIGDEYAIAVRIESHNHPTFINPYEGAATGVGGIMRDIFTMGARPIAILDFLRFGIDENSKKLLEKTIEGISYYGNCVGVPNIGGDAFLNKCYNTNPLVNVACIGIVKKNDIIYGNAKDTENVLIYVGSKTDNSGVGGAAMASKSFTNETEENMEELEKNIQKSDPFLEKLLLEACCELTRYGLAEGMQDMGAGGVLCASLEVVLRGRDKYPNKNMGCVINTDKIPVKEKMNPCDVLISETQERMLIVAKPRNIETIYEIFKKWDLEYSHIGNVNNSGMYCVFDNNTLLYKKNITHFNDINDYSVNHTSERYDFNNPDMPFTSTKIKDMSKWTTYDSTVGNRTIKGPDQPGSYSILDIYEINKKLFITWGETVSECYEQMSVFEGVKPLCVVNCLNFGSPETSMRYFINTVENITKECIKYDIPVVGGNVSMYNTTGDESIRPTPVIVMLGIN